MFGLEPKLESNASLSKTEERGKKLAPTSVPVETLLGPDGETTVFKLSNEAETTKRLEVAAGNVHLKAGMRHEAAFECERPLVVTRSDPGPSLFIQAVHLAYAHHYPLVLSPDIIWQCIAQGFSQHVNANAEAMRYRFVKHSGQATLVVRRDDFVLGRPNPWPEVFNSFCDQVKEHIGDDLHDQLLPDFGTTGSVEKAAALVVMMDTFKTYFSYKLTTCCGIPEIVLEGTYEDWQKLKHKAMQLAQHDLEWWTEALEPILDEFMKAKQGQIDRWFWSNIYKWSHFGSGGSQVTGWILALFPYIGHKSTRRNTKLNTWQKDKENKNGIHYGMILHGVETDVFPGDVQVPLEWDYLGRKLNMALLAGFMGVSQDPENLRIRPEIGWAVVHIDDETKQTKEQEMYSNLMKEVLKDPEQYYYIKNVLYARSKGREGKKARSNPEQ